MKGEGGGATGENQDCLREKRFKQHRLQNKISGDFRIVSCRALKVRHRACAGLWAWAPFPGFLLG